MVEGINVSQTGKPYLSNKGTVSPSQMLDIGRHRTHGENCPWGCYISVMNIHQVHGDAVNRDSIYAIKTLLPTVEST